MTFGQRVVGVLRLDASTFEEIEADEHATGQALTVVIGASVAAGLGAVFTVGPLGLARETFGAIVAWVMWAGSSYVIGGKLLATPQTRTDMGELLRVLGFAYAPVALSLVAVIPSPGFLHWIARLIVELWLLATMVMAVRQALDYQSTGRAVVVVLAGFVVFEVIQWLAGAAGS